MLDVGVGQKNSYYRTVAQRVAPGLQLRHSFNLSRQIRRCVDQEPALTGSRVTSDSDAGLRLRDNFPRARGDAVRTGTVPLRQATAGRAAENMNANQPKLRSMRPVRSHRACVTCALKENGHGFQHRFDPAFFGSSHESRRCHRSNGSCWSNYFFDEADVAAAFDASKLDLGKFVGMCAKTHVLV